MIFHSGYDLSKLRAVYTSKLRHDLSTSISKLKETLSNSVREAGIRYDEM